MMTKEEIIKLVQEGYQTAQIDTIDILIQYLTKWSENLKKSLPPKEMNDEC